MKTDTALRLLLLCLLCLGCPACSESFLEDMENYGSYGEETFNSETMVTNYVNTLYASPVFNKEWDNPDSPRWKAALNATLAAQAALTENGLDGCSNAKEWADMLSLTGNTFHKEAIIVKLLTDVQGSDNEYNNWEHTLRLPSQEGVNGYPAPLEMIDAFPMADGSRPTEEVKLANGSKSFFVGRDPRFYRTFAFSGIRWGCSAQADETVWAYRWQSGTSTHEYSDRNEVESPAFVRKMSSEEVSATENYSYSGVDIYEYRYAELILNLAECYAATGQTDEAVKWLGELRKRVGVPAGEDGTYGIGRLTDRHQAIEACLYERQIELAYEGKRFWDVWRWLLYDGGQGEGLALSDVNTCTALGITPLNGTHRTSMYVDVAPQLYTPSTDDPLRTARANLTADPDADNFDEQLTQLQRFWEENFVYGEPERPADRDNNNQVDIYWRPNYYVHGLGTVVLNNNSWLGQTVGWTDQNGQPGTVGWQDDELLTVE